MKTISSKLLKYSHYIFFIGLTITGLYIYKDFGFNVDETFTRKSGFYWLIYLSEFFNLERFFEVSSLKLNSSDDFTIPWSETYGIIFDLPAAIIEILFSINEPIKIYEMRHLLTFFYFLLGVIFLYKILFNRFNNKLLALFGCFLLVITPRIFGEIFHNSKDITFFSIFIITLYFYFKTVDKENIKNLIFFSLFSSICTSTRIFGIIIPIIFIFIYTLSVLSQKKEIKNLKNVILYLFFYFLFLYLHWPYLWEEPVQSFFAYVSNLSIFGPELVYFFGKFYNTKLVPFSYLPIWIFISTPILHLIFFFIGFYFNFNLFLNKLFQIDKNKSEYDFWKDRNEKKDFFIFILFLSFFVAAIFLSPKHYNGWRIFYFLNFFIIYYAVFFLNIFNKYKIIRKYFIIFIFTGSTLILINIYKIFLYHPYQSYYFNDLISKNLKEKFEGDFAGLSGIKFLREITEIDNSPKIKIAVNSWYPLWRMQELLPLYKKDRIQIIFDNKDNAKYLYSNRIYDVDAKKSKKYKLNSSFKIYKRYIVDDVVIYEIYKKN